MNTITQTPKKICSDYVAFSTSIPQLYSKLSSGEIDMPMLDDLLGKIAEDLYQRSLLEKKKEKNGSQLSNPKDDPHPLDERVEVYFIGVTVEGRRQEFASRRIASALYHRNGCMDEKDRHDFLKANIMSRLGYWDEWDRYIQEQNGNQL